MTRICLAILIVVLNASFLHAAESKFKFTFGSKVGGVPFEINKMSQNIKALPGIKINSWILSPNFSSFKSDNKLSNFTKNKISNDKIYMKFNIKF